MNFEMQKANMLAENIYSFIKFVQQENKHKNSLRSNPDKVYQIKLLIEEFRFQIIADELLRINQFSWDAKYTHFLVDEFRKGLDIIDEYIEKNYHDLFIYSARLYTLQNLCQPFPKTENQP